MANASSDLHRGLTSVREWRLRPLVDAPNVSAIHIAAGAAKTVGRSTAADIVVDEPSLSRRHARLELTADGVLMVEDLASTNGVFVNGRQCTAAALAPGDTLKLGFVEYCVEHAGARESALDAQTVVRLPVAGSLPSSAAVDAAALAGLLATSRDLMAFGDLSGLLERVLDRLQPILQPDRSAILLFDASTGELTARAVRPAGARASVADFASSTAVRQAIRAQEVLEAYDAAIDERLRASDSIVRAGIRSAVCVPLLGRNGPIGALYADRLLHAGRFSAEQLQYASAFAAHAAAALETARLYDDRERYFRATLESFAKAIDARDHYTAGHSDRVTAYTLVLARAAGIAAADLETIRRAGMLHDIGKVGVPDYVLRKPGPLDASERALMEAHVTIGYEMLLPLAFLQSSLPSIRGHHERWDGRGYPDRLGGADIHPHARLMAVADSYDAMTSARPYRPALAAGEAARRLRAGRGTQFDPRAVDLFDAVEREFDAIRSRAAAVEQST